MKRVIIATGAVLLASVPATLGLVGNTSFAQSVPVRVPQQASVLDDNGRLTPHVETGDDNGGQLSPSASESGDDKGGVTPRVETGDHTGGQRSDSATKSGDDNGGLATQVEPATGTVSDNGMATDDNGGHGGDTSGTDTSGSGGSGSGGSGSGGSGSGGKDSGSGRS